MASRMERYNDNSCSNNSRLSKNKELYENLYTSSSYAEFTDINSSNVIDLSSDVSHKIGKREEYQKRRDMSTFDEDDDYQIPKVTSYQTMPTSTPSFKNYDINSILDHAKKSRVEVDDLEKKRKLRTTEYNILADLTEEKLKEHKEKKRQVLSEREKDELEELVNTITSNTMRQEIDAELFKDLMPTDKDETVVSSNLKQQIELASTDTITTDSMEESDTAKLDPSFFTKSMDLSGEDLVSDEELDDSFKDDNNKSRLLKIIVAILVIVIIIAIVFIIYQVL